MRNGKTFIVGGGRERGERWRRREKKDEDVPQAVSDSVISGRIGAVCYA